MKRFAVFAAWLTAATYFWTLVRVADRPHPPIEETPVKVKFYARLSTGRGGQGGSTEMYIESDVADSSGDSELDRLARLFFLDHIEFGWERTDEQVAS